jgi:8-oxo-dGTP pyrophosphatase MutT (NUDIX family)
VSSEFESLGGETAWKGQIAEVRIERFRHAGGEEVTREVVAHQGAVGVVAHDDEHVWLVRQPREAIGDPALLELPAGKLDEEGESPLECAKRELAEEIGKAAAEWEPLKRYYSSAGFTNEECHIFLATGLRDAPGQTIAGEHISVEPRRLDELDAVIAECRDAKTLIGLLLLRARRG